MNILVFGRSGQLGRALTADPGVTALDKSQADLSQPATCRAAILAARPEIVINAAAYTQVDKAEDEEALATRINGDSPGVMAATCAELGLPFVHVSTDYVFGGRGEDPISPETETNPINAYGRSKAAGEAAVLAAGGPAVVLRTSWVFDGTGPNFVTTMLRLGRDQAALNIVADQIGGPTPADALAGACLSIGRHLQTEPEARGIYHYTGAPWTSWAGLARAIFDQAGMACTVTDIPSSAYPTPARRPLNSRLDCGKTTAVFALPQPNWRVSLARYLGTEAAAP